VYEYSCFAEARAFGRSRWSWFHARLVIEVGYGKQQRHYREQYDAVSDGSCRRHEVLRSAGPLIGTSPMHTWEYTTFTGQRGQRSDDVLQNLNRLGSEGWELVACCPVFETALYRYVFKRPKQ